MNQYSVIFLLVAMSGSVAAQVAPSPTLPELVAKQTQGPLLLMRVVELVPRPLDVLMKEADLIVYGAVTSSSTYLSDDQRDLFTDFTVTPIQVIVERNSVRTSSTPVPQSIIVKRWGGETVISGMQVVQEHRNLRAFTVGEELFLFLVYDSATKKYALPGGLSGAFAVAGGRLQDLVRHPFYDQVDGREVTDLVPEIQRAAGIIP